MKHTGKTISKKAMRLITEYNSRYFWNKTQEQIKKKSENMLKTIKKPKKKYQIIVTPTTKVIENKISPKVQPKTRSKSKVSTTDYYNCLLNFAQRGFYDVQEGKKQKIHACCKKCKLSAPALNSQRDQELVKLITSYKQVGDSLTKLLQPIK